MSDEYRLEEPLHHRFEASPGGSLEVDADAGAIRVETHDESAVEVEVIRVVYGDDEADARELLEDIDVDVSQRGDQVRVKVRAGSSRRGFFSRLLGIGTFGGDDEERRVEVVARVPRRFNLDLHAKAGPVRVGDVEGRVEVRTVAGPVRVGDVDGAVSVRTVAGPIDVGRVSGRVDARSTAGAIRVASAGEGLDARNRAGGVEASISGQPRSGCRLSTLAGNVRVSVAEGVGMDIEASTRTGRIRLPGQSTRNRRGGATVAESLNGGGPALSVSSTTGNITVQNAEGG